MKNFAVGNLLSLAFSYQAIAGHIDGNGTGALVDKRFDDDAGFSVGVSLFDIWEGRNRAFLRNESYDYRFPERPESPDTGPDEYLLSKRPLKKFKSVNPIWGEQVEYCMKKMKANAQWLPDGIVMAPPTDIDPTYLPHGFRLGRIATWNSTKKAVVIDKPLFDRIEYPRQYFQEALFFHEAVYLIHRKTIGPSASNSDWTRRITSCTYALNCPDSELKGILGEPWNGGMPPLTEPENKWACDRFMN